MISRFKWLFGLAQLEKILTQNQILFERQEFMSPDPGCCRRCRCLGCRSSPRASWLMGDERLLVTYASYLLWCRVWDYRTPPKYEDWLKLRDGKARGERANFIIGWEGVK